MECLYTGRRDSNDHSSSYTRGSNFSFAEGLGYCSHCPRYSPVLYSNTIVSQVPGVYLFARGSQVSYLYTINVFSQYKIATIKPISNRLLKRHWLKRHATSQETPISCFPTHVLALLLSHLQNILHRRMINTWILHQYPKRSYLLLTLK